MSYLNAIREIKELVKLRIIRWLLIFSLSVIISLIFRKIIFVFFSFSIAEIILWIIILFKNKGKSLFELNFIIEKIYLKFGSQTFLAEIIATLSDKLGIIILGYILNKNDIGVYSLLITIVSSLYFIQQVIMLNMNPIISKLYFEKKVVDLQHKVNIIMKYSFLLTIVSTIFLIPSFIILQKFLLVNQLNGYFPLFIKLLIAAFILAPFVWAGGMLMMGNYSKENLYRTFVLLILNIIFFSFFGSVWKLEGVAVAILFYNIISVIIQYFAIKNLMNIKLISFNNKFSRA
jgi:O-antigen/teichoic acid export membrane protein